MPCQSPCLTTGYYSSSTGGVPNCLSCGTGVSACLNSTFSTACSTGYLLLGVNSI